MITCGSSGRGPGGLIRPIWLQTVLQGQAALILLPEPSKRQHLAVALDGLDRVLLLRFGLPVPLGPGVLGPRLHVPSHSLATLGQGLRWAVGKATSP